MIEQVRRRYRKLHGIAIMLGTGQLEFGRQLRRKVFRFAQGKPT